MEDKKKAWLLGRRKRVMIRKTGRRRVVGWEKGSYNKEYRKKVWLWDGRKVNYNKENRRKIWLWGGRKGVPIRNIGRKS